MASGNVIFTLLPHGSLPTTTAYATLDTLSDASTVVGVIPCLDFKGAANDTHAEWIECVPTQYAAGGINWKVHYAPAGVQTGVVQFEVRAFKLVDGDTITSLNLQAKTAIDINDTPTGTTNQIHVTTTGTLTDTNMGNPTVGDYVRIRVSRDFDHDAMSDDVQVVAVVGYEV